MNDDSNSIQYKELSIFGLKMENVFIIISFQLAGLLILYFILKNKINKTYNTSAQIEEIRKEAEKIIVEINHTTERNIGLIEERIGKLSEIILKTDKRIGLLKREEEKKDISKMIYSNIVKKSIIKEIIPENNTKKNVLELNRNGFSSDVIANKTGITIGEVELIISLAEQYSNE